MPPKISLPFSAPSHKFHTTPLSSLFFSLPISLYLFIKKESATLNSIRKPTLTHQTRPDPVTKLLKEKKKPSWDSTAS